MEPCKLDVVARNLIPYSRQLCYPTGTLVTTMVGLQLIMVAGVPLKVTEPGVDPKLAVVMRTMVPTGAVAGDRQGLVHSARDEWGQKTAVRTQLLPPASISRGT
jgi:hypothetical protein